MKCELKSSPYAALLTSVSHSYPGESKLTLQGLDLAFVKGESVALIGPSGAGKSTLFSLLDGRLRGWTGAATVLDQALQPANAPSRSLRADIGFVFQEFALVEQASVYQNILNGRLGRVGTLASLFNRFTPQDQLAVVSAMRDAGVDEWADKRVDQLSGGQRQRVAIARCLAQEPRLILADEPVSNLDPARSTKLLKLLADTARKRGATLLFSSHQPELASQFCDRMIALNNGKVSFDGAPEELTEAQINRIYQDKLGGKTRLRLVG